jgi:hypothetical protein
MGQTRGEAAVVSRMEEAPFEAPSLASRVADAQAARLLVLDDLPEPERPRGSGRVLLVGIVWGGSTLVELEQVGIADDLSLSRLFDLPRSTLPKNFQLVKHAAGGHVVTLPDDLHAEVHRGRRVAPLARSGERVDAPFRGHAYTIGDDDRVVAQITPSLTLIARYVRARPQKDKPLRQRIDGRFTAILLFALLALLSFLVAVGLAPRTDPLSREALAPMPERIARYELKPEGSGARAAQAEGPGGRARGREEPGRGGQGRQAGGEEEGGGAFQAGGRAGRGGQEGEGPGQDPQDGLDRRALEDGRAARRPRSARPWRPRGRDQSLAGRHARGSGNG